MIDHHDPKFYIDHRYSTLENIGLFITGELLKSKGIRAMFSRPDVVKVNEYREHLNYVMQKFEVRPSVMLIRISLANTC